MNPHPAIERVRVIATAAVTWIVIAAAVADAAVAELDGLVPAPWLSVAARIALTLAAIVAIIRRVTPVLPAERGLLPPAPGDGGT